MNKYIFIYITFISSLFAHSSLSVDIDVLFIFSQDAIDGAFDENQELIRPGLGNESAARAIATEWISDANDIFEDNNTPIFLRICGIVLINDNLSNATADEQEDFILNSIEIDEARDRYGADIATLVVSRGNDPEDKEPYGFAVSVPVSSNATEPAILKQSSYIVMRLKSSNYPRWTFAHEVGHTLGAHHNATTVPAWFDNARGYSFENDLQLPTDPTYKQHTRGTLMAVSLDYIYNRRINRLSNPDETYREEPYFFPAYYPLGDSDHDVHAALSDSPYYITNIASPFPFIDSIIEDDEWRTYSWWNWFWVGNFPWVWHNFHGWIYVSYSSTSSNLVYYDHELGTWIYTNSSLYPTLYRYDTKVYIQYVAPSISPRNFVNFTAPRNEEKNLPN